MEIYENEIGRVNVVNRFVAENGNALPLGVILCFGALIGWRCWNSRRVNSARCAFLAFQNAVTA
ncbi:tetratricopeptide repeat protein, partial [Escherichia coli]|uniref:tetratricopeptide repeat protein n=1 Tax=Escherichia coli TaxID=562 RepID=UPI0011157DB4